MQNKQNQWFAVHQKGALMGMQKSEPYN